MILYLFQSDSFQIEEALEASSLNSESEEIQVEIQQHTSRPISRQSSSNSYRPALKKSKSDGKKSLRLFPHLNSFSGSVTDEDISRDSLTEDAIELQEVKKREYLDFPFLTDEPSIEWIRRNRVVFILRGLPGSGKSTLVNALTEIYHEENPVVCSADHWFVDRHGIYRFDSSRLKDAHESAQNCMRAACNEGKKLIIVDNTNVQLWEMRPYINHARNAPFTYRVFVIEPQTPWKWNAEELSHKNTHEVSQEVLSKRIHQYQIVMPVYFGWFLSPADSRSLYDRAMILFKNLYHSCTQFKDNFAQFSSMLNWGSAISYYRY